MDDQQRTFHVSEYEQLRSEILDGLSRGEALFFYAVITAAAISTWLITVGAAELCGESMRTIRGIAWWLPAFTTLCVGLLGFARYRRVKELGTYLKAVEARLGDPDLGWERFLKTQKPVVALTYVACWLALLASTIVAGAVMTTKELGCKPPPNTSLERTREG